MNNKTLKEGGAMGVERRGQLEEHLKQLTNNSSLYGWFTAKNYKSIKAQFGPSPGMNTMLSWDVGGPKA